jgi:antitoxin component of MazEF toxin-antitoxin module
MREIVKVRMVAGSLVVSLPQSVLDPVGLKEGDRVIVEAAPPRRLLITKEGTTMTTAQHLEMDIDLLEKRKTALESDLRYKEYQHNSNMPCDEGMSDNDVAILTMFSLVRDRDRLDVDIAEKRMQLYELQGSVSQQPPPASQPVAEAVEGPEMQSVPSTTLRIQKGWYYWKDKNGKGYFLAFVNARGSCSMRRFEADSGAALKKGPNPKGDYQDNFSEYLAQAVRVHLRQQPKLEDCKQRLPSSVLTELQQQIASGNRTPRKTMTNPARD